MEGQWNIRSLSSAYGGDEHSNEGVKVALNHHAEPAIADY